MRPQDFEGFVAKNVEMFERAKRRGYGRTKITNREVGRCDR